MRVILPFIVGGFIFYMSSKTGETSRMQSDFIVYYLTKIPLLSEIDFGTVSMMVRKIAHLFEYTILGFSTESAFYRIDRQKSEKIAFLVSVAFAMTDEFHQLFVDGRGGQIQDVLIDALGVMIGISLSAIFTKKLSK